MSEDWVKNTVHFKRISAACITNLASNWALVNGGIIGILVKPSGTEDPGPTEVSTRAEMAAELTRTSGHAHGIGPIRWCSLITWLEFRGDNYGYKEIPASRNTPRKTCSTALALYIPVRL